MKKISKKKIIYLLELKDTDKAYKIKYITFMVYLNGYFDINLKKMECRYFELNEYNEYYGSKKYPLCKNKWIKI